ncbi:MAG TPA: hypothetical protein VGS21_12670, partial [Acidimicrobiales bacterium]|nr:hypothetical protein [Acidimicrobiales bacterium]
MPAGALRASPGADVAAGRAFVYGPATVTAPASASHVTRSLVSAAATALLDERRRLTAAELAELAALPDEAIPTLAAAAHEVRLAWCGPEVEVEGILSAKTGGCPEDC